MDIFTLRPRSLLKIRICTNEGLSGEYEIEKVASISSI